MLKVVLLLLFLISGIHFKTSAQQFNNPSDYHSFIVNEQSQVTNSLIYFLNHFYAKDSILLVNYNITKTLLKESYEDIRNMTPYNNDTVLKNAALPLFELYYSAMDVEYKEIVDIYIKKDLGQEKQDRVKLLLNSISEREKKLDAKLIEAQTIFAKKYNLTIENNQLQKKLDNLGKYQK